MVHLVFLFNFGVRISTAARSIKRICIAMVAVSFGVRVVKLNV